MLFRLAPAVLAASISGIASAESVLLDIPSGNGTDITWSSSSGAGPMFFDITSSNFNFYENDYGTPGVVFAWNKDAVDDENPWGTNETGSVEFTAFDPNSKRFSSLEFQLSGYLTYQSDSAVRVFADDALIFSEEFSLAGNAQIETISLAIDLASTVRIELDNTGDWAWTGLDNIEVNGSVVPAPGALALLGLAGIAGNRRRRG